MPRATVVLSTVAILLLVGNAVAQFETRQTISTAILGPNSAVVGDFNRDGKPDLAVASYLNSSQISIFLGNGDGTFQAPVDYPAGAGPYSIAAADFNHDGKIDLAVADFAVSGTVSILLGNGNGSFQAPSVLPVVNTPTFVAVGDFNGDHKADLVLIAFHTISVMLGNGDGTFQNPINFNPPYAPLSLAIGDFSHNGKLDLAVGEQFGGISQVQIFLGNGDGTFNPGPSYPVGPEPSSVAVADFRGNGSLDLAVASYNGMGVSILLGNGDGTFQQAVVYPSPSAEWVITGDFNGDGKLDIASANLGGLGGSGSGVYVRYGNGDGTFGAAQYFPVKNQPQFLAAADFNLDHKLDLAVPEEASTNVQVLLNTGSVSFSPTTPLNYPFQLINTTSAPQTVTLANAGTTTLSISSFRSSGPFSETNTCGKKVAAGAKCTISVTFSPKAEGNAIGTVSIVDSASSKPQVIELTGAGTVVEFSPGALTFSAQKVGTASPPQSVTLTNKGTAAINITKMYVGGHDYRDFSETNTCPSSLSAGASCSIQAVFAPLKTGTRTAAVYVEDTGGGGTQSVPLTGTGD